MIEEILRLRSKGLTFRKIAEELDTTIGKVQYQWRKYKAKNEDEGKRKTSVKGLEPGLLSLLQEASWGRTRLVPSSYLAKWITGAELLFPFWLLIDVRRELLYSLQHVRHCPKAVRLYDVTYLPVAISEKRLVKETILESGKEALARRLFQPRHAYILELGVKPAVNKFTPLIRSNVVQIKGESE